MGANLSYPQVELKDKVAIVTGGNAGIGYETAKALAIMGAHTIIACRSEERGQQAIQQLKEEGQTTGKEMNVELMRLDLASLESTKNFIENFKQKNLPLHMLICNAGLAMVPHGKTQDNLEMHFQVNHLGHFFICLELLPCMMNTEGDKRIVLVSSGAAVAGVWDPTNLHGDSGYARLKFYGNSKLYNIMTMFALQRRITDSGITVSSLHPGMVDTEVHRGYGDLFWASLAVKAFMALGLGRSPEKGAVTTINCAVNPALNSQQAIYYSSNSRPEQATETARNEQFQEELWSISCDLLKDWMSPEIKSKYYTPSQHTQSSNSDGGNVTDKTTDTVDNDDKSPAEVVTNDGNTPANDKPAETEQSEDKATEDKLTDDKPADQN